MQDCIFCKIAAGQAPSTIVYRDDDVVAFKDLHPQAPHHILFIPRRHLASVAELTPEDGPLLASIFTAIRKVVRDLDLEERGYRIVTNTGPDSGQVVFHLHFHLLGGRRLL